jgi:hypothetical protein
MIRDYVESDLPALRAIHQAQGIDYVFPDLTSPLFLNRLVSANGANIIAAGLHRICYETLVLVNPVARPQEKWAALRELNESLSTRAYWQGLNETHAAVPPIGFNRRLRQLGWLPDRDGWQLWTKETNA